MREAGKSRAEASVRFSSEISRTRGIADGGRLGGVPRKGRRGPRDSERRCWLNARKTTLAGGRRLPEPVLARAGFRPTRQVFRPPARPAEIPIRQPTLSRPPILRRGLPDLLARIEKELQNGRDSGLASVFRSASDKSRTNPATWPVALLKMAESTQGSCGCDWANWTSA